MYYVQQYIHAVCVCGGIGFRVTDRPGWQVFIHGGPILPPAEMAWRKSLRQHTYLLRDAGGGKWEGVDDVNVESKVHVG